MSFDYANVGYKESGRLYNTAQHNQTQQQLVVKVEYRGGGGEGISSQQRIVRVVYNIYMEDR